MSVPSPGNQRHNRPSTSGHCGAAADLGRQAEAGRWATIRYALDSKGRTLRLCVITLVAAAPPAMITLLLDFHH
jgi:hypothetical protein